MVGGSLSIQINPVGGQGGVKLSVLSLKLKSACHSGHAR